MEFIQLPYNNKPRYPVYLYVVVLRPTMHREQKTADMAKVHVNSRSYVPLVSSAYFESAFTDCWSIWVITQWNIRFRISVQRGQTRGNSRLCHIIGLLDGGVTRLSNWKVEAFFLGLKNTVVSMNHRMPMQKIQSFGITVSVINWVLAFLTNRSFLLGWKKKIQSW